MDRRSKWGRPDGARPSEEKRRRAAGGLATGLLLAALLLASPAAAFAEEIVTHPFVGVTHTARVETSPRPLRMHIIDIDLSAPGLSFRVTPQRGRLETLKQTTLQYLAEQRAQIAVNAHFFEPWPAPDGDDGAADLVGLAASDGRVYSPFTAAPPKPYAIRPDAPALNIGADNRATIVHCNPADASGRSAAEPVTLYNAIAGNEQIVTGGAVTVEPSEWNRRLSPRTAVGLTDHGHLILFTVDGRQPGVSEGLSIGEVAELLRREYQVTEALDLDGGGSTTLAMADPAPRVVNVPVGLADKPGSERAVGSNLAVFARTVGSASPTAPSPAPADRTVEWLAVAAAVTGTGIVVGVWSLRRRRKR